MRVTSYRNLLWITALLASFCVAGSAQTPPGGNQGQTAVMRGTSRDPQQLSTLGTGAIGMTSSADSRTQTATSNRQAKSAELGQAGDRVEKAGIVPDSASLLPIAAVVGFSFLVGGIVCGTIKTRH